jgi:hypothetical protein
MNFWQFLKSEFRRDEKLDFKDTEYKQKRENVYVLLRLPWALEKFMFYGFLQCADSFLYICSVLPLRFAILFLKSFILSNPFSFYVK